MRIGKVRSSNLARSFGFGQKGSLAVGKDADIAVVDLNNTWKVRKEELFTKHQWSAFEGMELAGRPIATCLRGRPVYQEGRSMGEPQGQGLSRGQNEWRRASDRKMGK